MTSKPGKQNKGIRMPPTEAEGAALRQSQQAQVQLDGAIRGVQRAESQLRDNSREARSALHSSISRQQESLRCREVFLLAQIDFLEHLKGETLQQQLQQLYWLKGQFDVITHQLEHSNNNHDLTNQLTSCLEKLSFSLMPEETPDMSFHADMRSLKQTITSFGRIATQHMEEAPPLSPASLLQTCPVMAKKQKMEVGPLSDWLLGSQPASGARPGFQLSQNPQDWLLSQKAEQPARPPLASLDFSAAWGHLRDLETWLLQEKTPIARERANSGTDSTCSSSFSIEKIDESELANMTLEEEKVVVEEEEGFSMEEDELCDWLVTPGPDPGPGPVEPRSDAKRWKRVLCQFEESWLPSDWLQRSCPALEIENLGNLKCLKCPTPPSPTPPAPSPTPTPPPPSLTPTPPAPSHSSPPPLELWLQQACRANEPCSSFSQCVCEQNCGHAALCAWLLRQEGRDKNGVAKNAPPGAKPPTMHHAEQEQKVQAILEAWLHPGRTPSPAPSVGEEKASREERSAKASPCSGLFQRPLQAERWVAAPQPEEDKWLLRKRSQAQERLVLPTVCDLFSCMKIGDKDKWLHKAPEQM